jgi:hypothetical protein
VLLMTPLALISLRKLDAVTGAATCALTDATSVLLTIPFAFTSPTRTRIGASTAALKLPTKSATFARRTLRICAFETLVRLTDAALSGSR